MRKTEGSTLYAGTVVEEGECVFIAKAEGGSNRYDKIVAMIEESEKLKSSTENRALGAGRQAGAMVFGRNGGHLSAHPQRHPRHLLPDGGFLLRAQALHAAGRAFRHARVRQLPHHRQGRQVSGSAVSADTIVFDKTGTLTRATPQVVEVVPFSGCNEREVLQLAACLEEHFPHSMANAVVRAAKERGISHEEMHSEVEYIVAHGIASRVGGQRVVIGSHHFVFEDEKCTIPTAEQQKFDASSPRIRTCTWQPAGSWWASSASPTRCARKLPLC